MTTKHTAGEWQVKTSKRGDIVIHDETGNCIADCNASANLKQAEKEANAQLIAAAPKMLKTLAQLIHSIEHEGEIHGRIVQALAEAKIVLKK